MARTLFVAILAMCLVCILQAIPLPEQNQQPDPVNQIQTLINQGIEVGKQNFQTWQKNTDEFFKDPNIQRIPQDVAKFVQDGLKVASDSLNQYVPKTQ